MGRINMQGDWMKHDISQKNLIIGNLDTINASL